MEWQDILQYGLLIGAMFLMMRFGGCCGGHSHGSDKSNEHKSGCCGGSQTNKETETTRKDPVKG
ncbi:hypothetical protein AXX12_14950 [Anaerosporomusa subterranea]|jgi:putative component of membrane protein insertase Oxa1/YidC/SpoIIIJ protein YidD|uniref:DUF2933 domain-containing protein n=1 Tax=Anaerosporomusa subterranea TaxID=1794912 RepID=A0A154BMY3_ANASB|nr:hypothetical protein [Anaerosporomusa subterranea]KYZ74878.1 hypothetical protein AXX12_14950 [Anaerosporomusa subterranea]